jgi:hypothetical protein
MGALDPAPMVAAAFQYAMGLRMPCLLAGTCCDWYSDPQNFVRFGQDLKNDPNRPAPSRTCA